MKTNDRNKLIGVLAALRESYGPDAPLNTLRDAEFKRGGYVGIIYLTNPESFDL